MFLVAANTRQALVGQKEWITTGSSGIQVQFLFSADWDGLAKFAVFRNAEIEESVIPIALPASGLTELPAENCAAEYVDEKVYVGVYGTDGLGHIIIPTIWVSLGVLKEGAAYEGMDPPQPTQDMWAQILAIAQNAGAENAAAAEQSAEEAEASKEAIQDMNVQAETLPDESPLTVTKEVDPETGAVTLVFGLTRGPKGTKGDDGYSPTITITPIQGGHRFTVTDEDHPTGQSFDVMNGAPGAPGSPGQDGYSPAITITTITGGHRFTVTDEDHPTGQSFDVMDGTKGDQGYSPAVTITTITGGHRVTITDEDHPTGQSFDVLDGASDAGQVTFDPTQTYQSGTVGKELSDQKNAISANNSVMLAEATPTNYVFELGQIAGGTGIESDSTVRARTPDYIPYKNDEIVLHIGADYTAAVIYYDVNRNYKIGHWWFTGDYVVKGYSRDEIINTGFVRIVIKRTNDGIIDLDDVNAKVKIGLKGNYKRSYTVALDGSGDFDSLVTAVYVAEDHMDSTVYIKAGVYDMLADIGSDVVNNIDAGHRGLYLKNRIHLIGSGDTLITCLYSGERELTARWLSIFNAGIYGFTIENLRLSGKNIRYIIHDERDSDEDSYINRYINCRMVFDNTENQYTNAVQCIGGGLGLHGVIVIDNCYFNSINAQSFAWPAVSYHNSADIHELNGQSLIYIFDSYFENNNTVRINYYGKSTKITQAMICNNYLGRDVISGAETSDGSSPNVNVNVTAYCNIIRTDPTITQLSNAISANEESIEDTQSMIATVEATATASKNYAVNDLLVYGGKLYKVTSAIATGATIIVGSNVTQTTVEEQLGSGDSSASKTMLWSGDAAINQSITLSDDMRNYDYLVATCVVSGSSNYPYTTVMDVDRISTGCTYYGTTAFESPTKYNSCAFRITSYTTITFITVSETWGAGHLVSVVGVKL